jgi:hypothetical protein
VTSLSNAVIRLAENHLAITDVRFNPNTAGIRDEMPDFLSGHKKSG